jgi:8-oxo-dGTP diphosphatase
VPVYLVRHAKAGDRSKWTGPDDARPLSKKGQEQARRIADLLADPALDISRIVSSPSLRCIQTVMPLAERWQLSIEESDALAEGAQPDEVVGLIRSLEDEVAVLSTHGDVIPTLLDSLAERDGLVLPEDYPCAKGSTWVLETDGDGRFVAADYLPAPESL